MPSLEYFIVAESVSVDQTTNRVSLFNIVDEFRSAGFPAEARGVVAVSAWNATPDEAGKDFQVMLRVSLPQREPQDFFLNFRAGPKRHRIFHRIHLMALAGPGQAKFEVHLNGTYVASHTVTIALASEDAATSVAPPAT